MKNAKKILAVAIALLILSMGIVVATLAWLIDVTQELENTFVAGANVDITLTESTDGQYKIQPGTSALKDPKIEVGANSSACWVFIEVFEDDGLGDYIDYEAREGWVAVSAATAEGRVVYGRETAATAGQSFYFLEGAEVAEDETDEDKIALGNGIVTYKNVNQQLEGELKLTFMGYAIQADGFANMDSAWADLDTQMKAAANS